MTEQVGACFVIFREPDTGFGNFASIGSNFELRHQPRKTEIKSL
jgi:hypothetical protein